MPKLVALAFKSQSTAETGNALANHPIALHASTCDLSKDGGEFINVTYWGLLDAQLFESFKPETKHAVCSVLLWDAAITVQTCVHVLSSHSVI